MLFYLIQEWYTILKMWEISLIDPHNRSKRLLLWPNPSNLLNGFGIVAIFYYFVLTWRCQVKVSDTYSGDLVSTVEVPTSHFISTFQSTSDLRSTTIYERLRQTRSKLSIIEIPTSFFGTLVSKFTSFAVMFYLNSVHFSSELSPINH